MASRDSREITPHGLIKECVGDEFSQGVAYTNWRPEGSGDWLLILTIAGSGRIRVPSGGWATEPGEAVLFEPGAPQDYATDAGKGHWQLVWSHFQLRPAWREWVEWPVAAA